MGKSEFKPTRRELDDVRRYARECEEYAALAHMFEGDAPRASARMSSMASDYSWLAFRLSERVAWRGQA